MTSSTLPAAFSSKTFSPLLPNSPRVVAVALLTATTSFETWDELRRTGEGWDEAETVLGVRLHRVLLAQDR